MTKHRQDRAEENPGAEAELQEAKAPEWSSPTRRAEQRAAAGKGETPDFSTKVGALESLVGHCNCCCQMTCESLNEAVLPDGTVDVSASFRAKKGGTVEGETVAAKGCGPDFEGYLKLNHLAPDHGYKVGQAYCVCVCPAG